MAISTIETAGLEITAGSKRKANEGISSLSKRPKSMPSPDYLNSSAEESDHSFTSSRSKQQLSSIATPLTPFSPNRKPHSEEKTHLCVYQACNKAFNRPARLAEHLRSHNNERPYHCKYAGCDKSFFRETHLSHHVKSAHTDIRDFECDWEGCGKCFLTATRLKRHQAAHEGREKYRCSAYPPCNETFRKHSTLQKHITLVHLNEKPFPCTQTDAETGLQCAQGFDTAGRLRAHEGRIHGGIRFWCTECNQDSPNTGGVEEIHHDQGVGFPTYALLQDHLHTTHPPICSLCARTCTSQRELKHHIEIHHAGQEADERKKHLCPHPGCDRSFTKKFNLTIHNRTVHEGEKRFVCGEVNLSTSKVPLGTWYGQDACGRGFASKATLEEHVRTQHLGLGSSVKAKRNKQSTYHEEGSNKTADLISSIATLTGAGYTTSQIRRLACLDPSCSYRFKRHYDLILHLRTFHCFADHEISLLTFTQQNLTPDPFPFNHLQEGEDDTAEDAIANNALDLSHALETSLERSAAAGGAFSLDSNSCNSNQELACHQQSSFVNEHRVADIVSWEGESREMRTLVDGDGCEEGDGFAIGDGNTDGVGMSEGGGDVEIEMGGSDGDGLVGGSVEDEAFIDPMLRFLRDDIGRIQMEEGNVETPASV
ncbi:MAG: Strongly-conserved Zn-finger binding protein (TFIIIA) [Pycnora praestabilis]|nr:MAG: Strongly-conserved Zn-finger binding protein (TFIIIA) [Pycnora praestabilis]